MRPYIGTKLIRAEPEAKEGQQGYAVVYADGYRSWSPKDIFEGAYKPLDDAEGRIAVLDDHIVNPANDRLQIVVADEAGSGGAHHAYLIYVTGGEDREPMAVTFQNGPIAEAGVNGITHEALLAIVAHRLRCFNNGPFVSRENAIALTKIEEAILWLHKRTLDRMRRGVEGTHAK